MAEATLRKNQINEYRALWEFAHGVPVVNSTPAGLQISRSNTCNFKCVYCTDHRQGNTIPRERVADVAWSDLLGLIPNSKEVAFHGISEFMMDPEFFDIVQRCADSGTELRINTNGSVCTPKHVKALVSFPNLINIDFSLDAASPEIFTRIRGWDFWRVIRNIKTYADAFEKRKNGTWMTLSFVITKSSVHEMLPFLYLGRALKMNALIYYRLHEYGNLDWRIQTKDGGTFDYREEITSNFALEYNKGIENVRRAADLIDMPVHLPAALTEDELREMGLTA